MGTEQLWADLQKMKRENEEFLEKYKEEIWKLTDHDGMTPEEFLNREVWLEIMDRLDRLAYLIGYLDQKVVEEGILSRDSLGRIWLGDRCMRPFEECEIYMLEEELQQYVWTRSFVCAAADGSGMYLSGLGRKKKIDGMRARVRKNEEENGIAESKN